MYTLQFSDAIDSDEVSNCEARARCVVGKKYLLQRLVAGTNCGGVETLKRPLKVVIKMPGEPARHLSASGKSASCISTGYRLDVL